MHCSIHIDTSIDRSIFKLESNKTACLLVKPAAMKLNAVLLSDVTFASYLLAVSPEQKCETLIMTASSSIYEQSQRLELLQYPPPDVGHPRFSIRPHVNVWLCQTSKKNRRPMKKNPEIVGPIWDLW